MATSPVHSLILNMIHDTIEKLRIDLKPIENQLKQNQEGMFITHDGDCIVVYTGLRFKAYIPKKYDGWDVRVIEWKPGDELQISLDAVINLEV